MTATETAYAKLNLALHLRGRLAGGYHAIETLFAFAEDGDRVSFADHGLIVDGPFADALGGDADNLILRAASAYRARFGGGEAGFRLDKRLPVAAGLGGGSADAAAALRLLCSRDGRDPLDHDVVAIAAALGADVPACLASTLARGEGRGDDMVPAEGDIASLPVLLVNPRVAMPTGPVFRGWDGVDRGALDQGDALAVAFGGRNDLEAPAIAIAPVVGDVLALLRDLPGIRLARMSGSGATCFGLFRDADALVSADRIVAQAEPGWWRMATRFR
jgi:4-diphosphocytidyl-2-C-methyl-D-erythritol kinase